MEIIKRYFDNIYALLDMVIDTQSDAIERAVTVAADTLEQGGMIYAFGTGHSHMLAEELFYRAGGWSPPTKGVQRLSGPWLLGVAPFRSNAVALDRVAYPVCDLYVVPSMTAAFVHRSDVIYAWI